MEFPCYRKRRENCWSCEETLQRDIVKLKTRRLVNYINLLEGYRTLEIGTPEEVIEYE